MVQGGAIPVFAGRFNALPSWALAAGQRRAEAGIEKAVETACQDKALRWDTTPEGVAYYETNVSATFPEKVGNDKP